MKPGDQVQTTEEWTARWGLVRRSGEVKRIDERGPVKPERTVFVELNEPMWGSRKAWFDPADLEIP